jgi:hypothetical protein
MRRDGFLAEHRRVVVARTESAQQSTLNTACHRSSSWITTGDAR